MKIIKAVIAVIAINDIGNKIEINPVYARIAAKTLVIKLELIIALPKSYLFNVISNTTKTAIKNKPTKTLEL